MDIVFRNAKIKKLCTDSNVAAKKLGQINAKRLRQRLDDLHAAETLHVMRTLPGRCHELEADRAGQLSLDLKHPQRLIFEPLQNPAPSKTHGGLDWTKVTAVKILEITDTHG